MSRSLRHSPIIGRRALRTASDKSGKKIANGALRARQRDAIKRCADFSGLVLPVLREVSWRYDFPKGGKALLSPEQGDYQRLMRK